MVGREEYLYLGRANNIGYRLNECFQKSKEDQEIVKYIPKDQEGHGNTLKVKWIEEPKHESRKDKYLEKLQDQLGYQLRNKFRHGNDINRQGDEKDNSQISTKQSVIKRRGGGKKQRSTPISNGSQNSYSGTKATMKTRRPDWVLSGVCEKGETSGEISERRGSELNRKRPLGGGAAAEKDIPPAGAPPPKLSKMQAENEVQGPSDISDGSTSLNPAPLKLNQTQSESEMVAE